MFSAMFLRSAVGSARVVGVEPTAHYASVCRDTMAANAAPRHDWAVHQIALLDDDRATTLADPAFEEFFAGGVSDPAQQVEAETTSHFCDRIGFAPDLVKIDVDGFEYEILLGAPDFLRRHRPKVHLEIHFSDLARRGKDAERVLQHVLTTHRVVESVPGDYRRAEIARLSLEPLPG